VLNIYYTYDIRKFSLLKCCIRCLVEILIIKNLLTPVAIFILFVICLDQLFLHWLVDEMPGRERWVKSSYIDYAINYNPSRPQLIIIGSSRAEDIAPVDLVQKILSDRGLPHQAINLSIGGGGTPSMLYVALKTFTPFVFQMPPGSRVIYIFSKFEMNHLKMASMKSLPKGYELLEKFGIVNMENWAHQFKSNSGFARGIAFRYWQRILPKWASRIADESTTLFISDRVVEQRCNVGGRYNYQILPINDWSLRQLIGTIKDQLLLVQAPVSKFQKSEDVRFGLEEKGNKYLNSLISETGVKFDDLSSFKIKSNAFSDDCDHVSDKSEKMRFINKILDAAL
jgi:hypothetical protein